MRVTTILSETPEGWWYHDKRPLPGRDLGIWVGPFESRETTEAMAQALVPDTDANVEYIKVVSCPS